MDSAGPAIPGLSTTALFSSRSTRVFPRASPTASRPGRSSLAALGARVRDFLT